MRIKLLAIAAFLLFLPAVFAQPVPKVACDRACLEKYIDRYLDAVIAKKVDPALFARELKFTENGVRLPMGNEGLWYDMAGKGNYKFYVPDTETQQVAFIGTALTKAAASGAAKTGGTNKVALAIRLKIMDGLITEVEQLVIRPTVSLSGPAPASKFPPTGEAVEKMGSPHKIFSEVIPEAERPIREELIRIANYYFTGLQKNDTKGYYPFSDDCERYENGSLSTKECKKQFESGALRNIVWRIRDRRFVAVDRERGIVFAFGFFDHPQINWTWQIAELFKIEKGNIRRIEAVFQQCPYGMDSGWSPYELSISDQIQSIR